MKPEGSLPHSQQPATCPYPEQLTATMTDFQPICELAKISNAL
jgi:hypothetical protein